MKEVYAQIRERNSALFTDDYHLVYIATPSGWDDEAKSLYGQIASNAGLPMGGITSESRAAFIKAQQDPDSGLPQYIDKGTIVFDMGSSTLDFTYLTRDSKNPIDWGDDCGASKVEKIIYASKRDGNEEIQKFEQKYPKIANKPIHVAFLTGGASRMDFIKTLVKECWGLSDDRIYRDQDPPLTISQGVAILGRGYIRSGGSENTKDLLREITANANDIYTPFAVALTEKIPEEMQTSVVTAFQEFRDASDNVSLYDLQCRIEQWIESDTNSIGEWATECYQQTFEEKTADIRAKLDSIVGEFSNSGVQLGRTDNVNLSLPDLDLSDISEQMSEIGANFAEEAGSITESVTSIAIDGAVGFGIGMLVGGPLAWVLLGGYLAMKYLFGNEESEAEKKRKAMQKDLDASARLQVYNAFFSEQDGKWYEVAESIADTVREAIYGNSSLKKKINEQSQKIIRDYAQECINQTRLMVE